jgi:hypothetical protein
MLMKKNIFIVFTFIVLAATSGCGQKPVNMDVLSSDEKYHYTNKDLGFSIDFPKEFDHYQAQRKKGDDFTDLEFFVPTADTAYPMDVPGYAKPIVIRIIETEIWQRDKETKFNDFEEIKIVSGKTYAIKFWQTYPKDWLSKWNSDIRKGIKESFKSI